MRLFRAPPAPPKRLEYTYLVDVAGAQMARVVVVATDNRVLRHLHTRALKEHLAAMQTRWGGTPRLEGTDVLGVEFDGRSDARMRQTLLADVAMTSPLDAGRVRLSDEQRLTGLRGLSTWLGLGEVWGDRVLEARAAVVASQRRSTSKLSLKRPEDDAPEDIVRLQLRVGYVDGWALPDPDAVDRGINLLAVRRAELDLDAELRSEREQAQAVAAERAIDRALEWLSQEHERAVRRSGPAL